MQVESVSKHMLWEARHKVCGRLSPVGRHYVPSEDRQAKACHNTHQVSLPVLREREREASVTSQIFCVVFPTISMEAGAGLQTGEAQTLGIPHHWRNHPSDGAASHTVNPQPPLGLVYL